METRPALLVTGFHRSGTSLTAKRLQASGFALGEHLLPAHPSNPDGHFEDSAVVEFNDAWLQRQGTNWLFNDEVALGADPRLQADIRAYVAARDAGGAAWALKDPRLCLNLPAWDEALGARGRYLLVIRHWGECAQSLIHRHSREMANGLLPPTSANFRFWLDPTIAYRAWLSSSARLLAFAAALPGRAVLVSTRAIAELADLGTLAQRLGVELPQPEAGSPVRAELLHRRTARALLPTPPLWLERSLDAMWADLLTLCELRSADEDVAWDERRQPHWVRAGIDDRVRESFPLGGAAPALRAGGGGPLGTVAAQLALLPLVPPGQVTPRVLTGARVAFNRREYADAEHLLRAGLALTNQTHPLWLLLGDVETARGNHDLALEYVQASLALHATDHARMKLARAFVALARWQDAIDVLDAIVGRQPDHADARLLRARALERRDGHAAALASLEDFRADDPAVGNVRVQLTLAADAARGLRQYEDLVRLRLADADLIGWLAGANRAIQTPEVWQVFVEAVCRHWAALLGADVVRRKLALAALPEAHRLPSARPPVAVSGLDGAATQAVALRLQARGWAFEGEAESPLFGWLHEDSALAGREADDPALHAALVQFLEGLAAAFERCEPEPIGWGWQHPDTHWFAASLLENLPNLHYVYVHAGPEAAAAGWPLARGTHWAERRLSAGAQATTAYWTLKYWVAAYRHGLALQRRFPGRVLLLDQRSDAATQTAAWAALLGDGPLPAPMAVPADAAWRGAAAAAGLDPADLEFLRGAGL